MITNITSRLPAIARRFGTSAIRRSHDYGGVPGQNMPFDIKSPFKFTVIFTIFMTTGMAIPFFVVRHQLLKQ